MPTSQLKQSRIRKQYAIITAQSLSYILMITFIFANARFDFIGSFANREFAMESSTAYLAACLIGIVGTISIWLTWYYATKSNSIRDMLVICAWTHRVKADGKWVPLEEFFTNQLGYAVSHGLSEARLVEMRQEIDTEWRNIKLKENGNPQLEGN